MITPFLCKVIPVIGVNLKEGFKFISILTHAKTILFTFVAILMIYLDSILSIDSLEIPLINL